MIKDTRCLGILYIFLLYKNRNFGGNGGSVCTLQYPAKEPLYSNSTVVAGWLKSTKAQNIAPVIVLSIFYF